jgi:PAS domain S-box-containing protein
VKLAYRLIILALVAILPAIAIQVYNAFELWRERTAEVNELATDQALLAASEIDRILGGVRSLLVAVSEANSVRGGNASGCIAHLARLVPRMPHIASISAADTSGDIWCRDIMPAERINVADRTYFTEIMAGADYVVGNYVVGRISNDPVLPIAMAIHGDAGETIGVAIASLSLDWLTRNLADRGFSPGGSVTVADRNGVIIAREPLPERFVGTQIPEQFMGLVSASSPGAVEVTSQDGTRRVLGYVPVGYRGQDVYVSAGLSSEAAFAVVEEAMIRSGLLLAAGLFAALAAGLFAGRRFIKRPVDRLLNTVRAWQTGNFSVRTGLGREFGEFGQIGTEMDRLAATVEQREREFRESEERYRALVHASAAVEWRADATGAMLESPLWEKYTGQPAEEHRGNGWVAMVHPDDRSMVRRAWDAAHVSGAVVEIEYRVRHAASGQYRWVQESGVPLRTPDGKVREWVGAVTDIHERKLAEERRRLPLNELNHRVKNTLSIVQAIVAQTLRSTPEPKDASERVQSRLQALLSTHNILHETNWSGAELREILAAELAPYRETDHQRLTLEGPDVWLDAKAAVALGLVIHELATNAAKYGSLSLPEGRLAVNWSIARRAGKQWLDFSWQETDGPPVITPERQGFGSRLIDRTIAGDLHGEVEADFSASGLTCRVSFPLESAVN